MFEIFWHLELSFVSLVIVGRGVILYNLELPICLS